MRTSAALSIAGSLMIALAMPRAARSSEPAKHPAARLVVMVSAKPVAVHAAASATTAGVVEAVSTGAFTPALPDQRLFRLLPTWGTIAGHTHAGFSLSGRF